MAKAKANTRARKSAPINRIQTNKAELSAALSKLHRAIDAVDLALTDHGAAVDTQRILHYGQEGQSLSDAFGWVLDSVYSTKGNVSNLNSAVWDAFRELGDLIDPGRKQRRAQLVTATA